MSTGTAALALTLLTGLATVAPLAPAQAEMGGSSDTTEATATVSRLQAGLLAADRHQAGAGVDDRFAAFAPLVDGTHDLPFMARLSLGAGWEFLAPADRMRFQDAFRRLSILDYATRFRDTGGASFRVAQARATTGARVTVNTVLSAPGEAPVQLDYVLHATPEGWRIVNILSEGVSELALQRAQYQQLMKTGGFEGLMSQVTARITELEQPL